MTDPARTPTEQALHADVAALAAMDRLPCSPGERAAAEWIAERLGAYGARVTIDDELVHGTYYTPLGIYNGIAVAGGLLALAGRRAGALAGALSAAGIWQDLTGGPRPWLRPLLRRAHTTHVVAEVGDGDAAHRLVVHAHHDAARTSFIVDQTVPRFVVDRMPWVMERRDRWPPLMGLVVAGPAAVAVAGLLGLRRVTALGTALAAGTAALMAHMSRQPVVPGANDNLTGVAVLLEVARQLGGEAPDGLRIVLLSTGSEEANQDGMLAFARRHFGELDRGRTTFLCLDTVGSPELVLIEGEGFLRMRDYDAATKDLVEGAARDAGVHVRRGLRFTFATDALIPLRQGFRVAGLGSVNEWLVPTNYHAPTDTPDNVDFRSVRDAVGVVL